MPSPSSLLTPDELKQVKSFCVDFNAQWVEIEGNKFMNLPLEKFRGSLVYVNIKQENIRTLNFQNKKL